MPLDQVPRVLGIKTQQEVDLVDVPRVEPDRVPVWHGRRRETVSVHSRDAWTLM